jgi:hypothetical protein
VLLDEKMEVTGGTLVGEIATIGERLIMEEVGTDGTIGTEIGIIAHERMVQENEAHLLREIIAPLLCQMDSRKMIRKKRKASKCREPFIPF